MSRNILSKLKVLFIFLVIVSLTAASVYFYLKYQELKNKNQSEVKKILAQVGRHILLPKDEVPTLATVDDKTKLPKQEFFKNAENGDKVLIFQKSKKAILYRPSVDKIIEVSPIKSLDNNQAKSVQNKPSSSEAETEQQEERLKVYLLNGSQRDNATFSVGKEIEDAYGKEKVKIIGRSYAKKRDYNKTLVVDLTGKNQKDAERIAEIVNGTVSALPEVEESQPADILVIVGGS